ncbi:MAG: hypothetical protein HQL72_02430 [Magnetococcales bacterium]|nr:hypothetical protein [Magnetococcales bacterium]
MDTTRETFLDVGTFILMILSALAVDLILHRSGHLELGRYLGYVGTGLLVLSFLYSARKRKWIKSGRAPFFLRFHETLSWLGAMLILVHGGIHFNALLPWLAMASMLVAVASGLTGKYLLKKSKGIIKGKEETLLKQGLTKEELKDHLYWDALVVDVMKRWRVVHIPITITFALLTLLHVATVLIFWRW